METYDTSQITVLTTQEHIRKRPGMFLGSTDLRGVLTLFYEVLKELSFFSAPLLDLIFEVKGENKYSISVKNIDYEKLIYRFQNQLSVCPENGYNYGLECLIAFSEDIDLIVINDEKQYFLQKNEKDYQLIEDVTKKNKENNITMDFSLNKNIFETVTINYDVIFFHFQRYTYLNPSIHLILKDNRNGISNQNLLHYPNGIADELDKIATVFKYGNPVHRVDIFEVVGEREYRISFCFSGCWVEKGMVKTFANNDDLIWGGSIEKGLYKGIGNALAIIAKNLKKSAIKNAKIKEYLCAIAHVKGGEMVYTGSVRCALAVDEVEAKVAELVCQKCLRDLDNEAFYGFFKR